jgi:hypothetical protein
VSTKRDRWCPTVMLQARDSMLPCRWPDGGGRVVVFGAAANPDA